jgi:hypothetical protein
VRGYKHRRGYRRKVPRGQVVRRKVISVQGCQARGSKPAEGVRHKVPSLQRVSGARFQAAEGVKCQAPKGAQPI